MKSISIYIHWPFCVRKCNYCDLNSHVDHNHKGEEYVEALGLEIEYWAKRYPDYLVETIFFGGGTPSLMRPEWIKFLINKVQDVWKTDNIQEITLEANPATKECDLYGIRNAGVNRISLGVQSFDDPTLKILGRTHTASEARQMIIAAKSIFDKVSIDLMYNLPQETDEIISNTLDEAMLLGLDHISIYALTIEPSTLFGQIDIELPNEDGFCSSYDLICKKTSEAGLNQYEISNFARPGYESRHNLVYWRYGNWLGIGPGAHGRMNKEIAIENEKLPKVWLAKVMHEGCGAKSVYNVQDAKNEEFLMRLRLSEGISRSSAIDLLEYDPWNKLSNLVYTGDISLTNNHFRLTSSGFLRYNGILKYLYNKLT